MCNNKLLTCIIAHMILLSCCLSYAGSLDDGVHRILYQKVMDGSASLDDIVVFLQGDDEEAISNGIGALVRYRNRVDVAGIMEAIWRNDRSHYGMLNWEVMRSNVVMVSVAFVLYSLNVGDVSEYDEYIRGSLYDGDSNSRSRAALVLGLIGSNDDISILSGLVLSDDVLVSIGAVTALGVIGTNESRLELEYIRNRSELSLPVRDAVNQVLKSDVWGRKGGRSDRIPPNVPNKNLRHPDDRRQPDKDYRHFTPSHP